MRNILFASLLLLSCGQQRSEEPRSPEVTAGKTTQAEHPSPTRKTSVAQLVSGNEPGIWVGVSGRGECDTPYPDCYASIAHFDTPDTMGLELHSECWISYPLRVSGDSIHVTWSGNTDTKYPFPIVSAIRKAAPKFRNKEFMSLVLLNDSTLKAIYQDSSTIARLNQTKEGKVFFPSAFVRRILP